MVGVDSLTRLESRARAGDSPLNEIGESCVRILSSTGQVETCVNLRELLRKAKYSISTDSGQVP